MKSCARFLVWNLLLLAAVVGVNLAFADTDPPSSEDPAFNSVSSSSRIDKKKGGVTSGGGGVLNEKLRCVAELRPYDDVTPLEIAKCEVTLTQYACINECFDADIANEMIVDHCELYDAPSSH